MPPVTFRSLCQLAADYYYQYKSWWYFELSEGEKGLHYWFSIVLVQDVVHLSLRDLKKYTLVSKSISKLVRDYIQRNFWFRQRYSCVSKWGEIQHFEKRYLWYSPYNFKNVKDVLTLPINTTGIHFDSKPNLNQRFPLTLQHVTHITFGSSFDQPIGCGINSSVNNLPLTLTHLELSWNFYQSVDDLPPNLTLLCVGFWFNNRVDHLPPKLTHLTLSEDFNKPLNKLPLSLTHLTFTSGYQKIDFSQPLSQLQRNFETNLEYLILSIPFITRYERSIPRNFKRLGYSEKLRHHVFYKRQPQQQPQQKEKRR